MSKQRKDYMTPEQKIAMGSKPRSHANCVAATKVARPGKTAKDRSNKGTL